MAQYVTVTYTDGDGVDHDMLEVRYPDKMGKVEFERSYTCCLCGLDYKAYDICLVGGIPFCIPNKCYTEANEKRRGGDV